MTATHYGVTDWRVSCGKLLDNATTDRDAVTCQRCRSTLQYQTSFFDRAVEPVSGRPIMSDTNDTYPEHGDEHDFADGFCQYPNCDVRLPEPAEPEVKARHTPGYYLGAARASLANTLRQRVEYRDTIVDEIIRLQARLAEWEDQLTDVRGECEAMAAALEAIPTTKY